MELEFLIPDEDGTGDGATTFRGWEHGGGVYSRGRGTLIGVVTIESGVIFCIVTWNSGSDALFLSWSRRVLFVGPRSKLRQ